MSAPSHMPIDYAAYVHKARVLRAQALAAVLADLRQRLRAALRMGGAMRLLHTR
jgi:hypothetical protein